MTKTTLYSPALLLAVMLYGCAGEDDAQRLAAKASTSVTDLKLHVDRTMGDYQFARTEDYDRLSALKALAVDTDSQTNARATTWDVVGDKVKSDLLKTYKTMTPKSALSASAASILIEPVPPFKPTSLDEKAMNSLVAKLGSLAKDPTLVSRLVGATDYFLKVQAAYNKTVENSQNKPAGSTKIGSTKSGAGNALAVTMAEATPDKGADSADLTSYLEASSVEEATFRTMADKAAATKESKPIDPTQLSFMAAAPKPPAKPAAPPLDLSGERSSASVTDQLIQDLFPAP
ncbi:MAG: hypothetical protein HYU58_04735 [Proteobacteria bacterium]|nr:hypothetical protein [Pseudomonadota bacterium]